MTSSPLVAVTARRHRPTNFWWWLEPGADLGLRTPDPDHALFDHLTVRDCTWHYHGVLDPPDSAEPLVTLPTDEALLHVDRISTRRVPLRTSSPHLAQGGPCAK